MHVKLHSNKHWAGYDNYKTLKLIVNFSKYHCPFSESKYTKNNEDNQQNKKSYIGMQLPEVNGSGQMNLKNSQCTSW